MHVLVTGHTGFKGAWLTLMLHQRGHEVSGLSLDPAPGSLFERARLSELIRTDLRVDVRDADRVRGCVAEVAPDAVLHLAAQPLVRESYRDPRATVETNTAGTFNVLDAVQQAGGVRAHLVITTDKVYRNVGQATGYREPDPLGGLDPYSASKAAADLLTQSWIASTTAVVPTAIARAGNVVGGGDVSAERLMVDLLAAFTAGVPASLRNPAAVRPWQHVLDCLHGYLVLLEAVLDGRAVGDTFNFGPPAASSATVGEVATRMARRWGSGASWQDDSGGDHPHEAALLTLDSAKAETVLGWRSVLSLDETLDLTVDWARRVEAGQDAREVTLAQADAFAGLVADRTAG